MLTWSGLNNWLVEIFNEIRTRMQDAFLLTDLKRFQLTNNGEVRMRQPFDRKEQKRFEFWTEQTTLSQTITFQNLIKKLRKTFSFPECHEERHREGNNFCKMRFIKDGQPDVKQEYKGENSCLWNNVSQTGDARIHHVWKQNNDTIRIRRNKRDFTFQIKTFFDFSYRSSGFPPRQTQRHAFPSDYLRNLGIKNRCNTFHSKELESLI